jgi:hypothetical protein
MSEIRIPDAAPVVGSFQLALRFVLEAAALVALGGWARHVVGPGALGWAAALATPAVVAAVWGVFAVPGDPTRGGKVPVPVSGWLRIGIEMAVFLGAAAALVSMEWWRWFDPFIGGFVVHHVGTRQRIVWLLR